MISKNTAGEWMSLTNENLKRLKENLANEGIVSHSEKLVLGVSAGADSTALLYLFSKLRYDLNLSLLAVHINHNLRGEESDADEKHIAALAMKLNIPMIVRHIRLEGESDIENRARVARFEIFEDIRKSYKFDKIVLGHHKWDQAETLLLNLFRGAGLGGLAGIRPIMGEIVHPILIFDPHELKEMLTEEGISWREDLSNQELRFSRNRLRQEILPQIEEHYNPLVREKLYESAAILNLVDQYIMERSLKRFKRACIESKKGRVMLNLPELLKAPQIEQYYILREAYSRISGTRQDFFQAHIRELNSLFESDGSKYITLSNNVYAIRRYEELIFTDDDSELFTPEAEVMVLEPNRALAVHMEYRFQFKYLKVLPDDFRELPPMQIIVDADKIVGKLSIRQRKAGDRFIPFGMNGMKKLKDFFIDEKVPKYDRDLIPVFEDEEKIVWVCGHRIDQRVSHDENSLRYLMISAEPITMNNRALSLKKKRNE